MSRRRTPEAERREGLFLQIARRPGGARAVLLAPEVLERAEKNLKQMTPDALREIGRIIEGMKAVAESRSAPELIWQGAHDLRGLAGAFGLHEVGVIAGAVRTYIQDSDTAFEPDWDFTRTLMIMLLRAFNHPSEMSIEAIAAACEDAVAAQMAREGRGVTEDLRVSV